MHVSSRVVLAAVLLFVSYGAAAGVTITGDTRGFCEWYASNNGGSIGSPAYLPIDGYADPNVFGGYVIEWEITWPGPNGTTQPCYERVIWYYEQDYTNPNEGDTDQTPILDTLQTLYGRFRNFINPNPPLCRQLCNGQSVPIGVRGKLSGFSLLENSPDWITYVDNSTEPLEGIPFVVTSTSGGATDWLEFSVNGDTFWRAPLSDFQIGREYVAVVPQELRSPEGIRGWTAFLISAGDSGSSVLIPDEFEPDAEDADADGIVDTDDLCLETAIPESAPTSGELKPGRYALTGQDGLSFSSGAAKDSTYSTADTGGCSCEQIVSALGVGPGQMKWGCSGSVMEAWTSGIP